MRVAVRADASRHLGWGHVKRCLALAQALRELGAQPRFFCAESDVDALALVRAAGLAGTALFAVDDLQPLADWQPALALVDHYGLDARWHAALRAACGARIAVVDDLADRPLDAELLIDHNPHPDHGAKYAGRLLRPAVLCGGPSYALLDAAYAQARPAPFCERLDSIGIFIGGTDAENFSGWAWAACRNVAGWTGAIEIATTRANPQLGALQQLCAADSGTVLQLDQPNLAAFHARHGLQIGAGGGAAWERCCLGTPAIVLVCADNQLSSVPALAAAGAALTLDARAQDAVQGRALGALVRRLAGQPEARRMLRERALALVDGRGAQRAAAAVMACA